MDTRSTQLGRKSAWLGFTALLVAIAVAIGAPSTASAGDMGVCVIGVQSPCNAPQKVQPQLAGLDYTGWVYFNLNYCATGFVCTQQFRVSVPAWKWTGKGWAEGTLKDGWVYVAPFSGDFRWVYSADSGWVAYYGGRFEVRPF